MSDTPAAAGTWDDSCDVVVVGSGGGALVGAYVAAAHGLEVVVLESTGQFGGTTAYSGGGMWLPGNDVLREGGIDDSVDEGRRYYRATVGDRTPAALQDAFLENGRRMVAELRQDPVLRFMVYPFPDYFTVPGAVPTGRHIMPEPVPVAELGELADQVRHTIPNERAGLPEDDLWSGGRALIGRLLKAITATGRARLHRRTPFERFVVEDGAVVGVEALADGKPRRVQARRGVLVAAGGFDRNEQLRLRYQGPLTGTWTMGAPGGTGRALEAGLEIGAAVDLLDQCWYTPGMLFPDGTGSFVLGFRGGIIVNGGAERYANESLPYDQFGRAMLNRDGEPHLPSYWIFDSRFEGVPPAIVIPPVTDAEPFRAAGLWHEADTLEELADRVGLPAGALAKTVEEFNRAAAAGVDERFHRGEAPYDRFFVDPTAGPNPALVPLDRPPYTAVTMILSDLGTKGGLVTDEHARVQREGGGTIPGLYAAGNSMASVTGLCYPGPGNPIGTSMTFSYLAALDMVERA